ncbi:DUF2920 family protein [Magnetovibrio sp. PR-2]|uniref:DUF2920 family protein n=1 Tax=Magnetovibrio sp. PR-2 TaxID=3120356 RepID=UPI002FCE2B57
METRTLKNPPLDLEAKIDRLPVTYYLARPENGMNDETGLLFWIGGWGMLPTDEYSQNKLMQYLADEANVVVVALEYQGIKTKCGEIEIGVSPEWKRRICERYGIPLINDENAIFDALKKRGITQVEQNVDLALDASWGGDYLNWGLLPALDHVAVLGEILQTEKINTKKLILFGTSYGGYIVTMILKLLPNTFSCAIENSGFTGIVPRDIANAEHGVSHMVDLNGVTVPVVGYTPWTFKDPDAPNFFKPAFAQIRDLLQVSHFTKSETVLYAFHSTEDQVIPVGPKVTYCTFRQVYAPTHLKLVSKEDLDGGLFKVLTHGMEASMKKMFDYVRSQHGTLSKDTAETDISAASKLTFECEDMSYILKYNPDGKLDYSLV